MTDWRSVWEPRDLPYGQLPLYQRKRIACISKRNRVNLTLDLAFDTWLDQLPLTIGAQILG